LWEKKHTVGGANTILKYPFILKIITSQASNGEENDHELQQLIASMDADGDGGLSYHELLLATAHRKLLAKEERMWMAFQALDHNGDGEVCI